MKYIYHEREGQVIYSLRTDRQPVINWATNNLFARICFDSKTQKCRCILQTFLQIFCHFIKKNNPIIYFVIDMLMCIW